MEHKIGMPVTRTIDGKSFKISLPLCRGKKDIESRKEWLKKKGYKYFRTYKEKGGIALYASK